MRRGQSSYLTGSSRFIDMTLPDPDITKVAVSSWTNASIGVVPQPRATGAQVTLRDEVSSAEASTNFGPVPRPRVGGDST
jgi:hypothetical protein